MRKQKVDTYKTKK